MNAIVSGATKGIGRAICEKLIREGMHVAFCARHKSDVEEALAAFKKINPAVKVVGFVYDLSIPQEAKDFGKEALHALGSVQLLVNNAGMFIQGNISTEDEGALEKMIATNLYSAYHLTRSVLPSMLANEAMQGTRGHIINISSVAGLQPYALGGSYSISKFALQGFSENLRHELKSYHIKVSTIQPGATMSDSWKGSNIEESRIMKAQDIGDTVWYMYQLSPQTVVEDIVLRPQLGDL